MLSYVDGSFTRIRNITLGYTFDTKVTEYLGLETLRLYATAQNPFLFTATDLEGYDPETGRGNLDDGILDLVNDYTATPRTFLFGLNVSF